MKKVLLFLILLVVVMAVVLRIRYGGGEAFVAKTSTPLIDPSAVELVLSYPEPIGNVAVNRDGRLFFTVHPESRPRGNKLLEFVDGASVPFPDGGLQQELFDTVLGVVVDSNNRLWTIDHGNHGLRVPRLVGIDLNTDEIVRNQPLDETIAPKGSFLQDLQVSRDGRTIVIADASFWRKRPAIVVYDIETGEARRVLEGDLSVYGEDYTITSEGRTMSFLGGLLSLRGGIDGIALDEEWLYYGALSGASLYRVRLSDLRDRSLPDAQLASRVERVSDKPLSDGMSVDLSGQVYLTDVENNALFIVDQERRLKTLVQDERIRWPDALSFGPDGWLYVADSALSEVVFRSSGHMQANQPYSIFRLRPGAEGVPGQ